MPIPLLNLASHDGLQVWFRYGEHAPGDDHTREYRFHTPIHVDAGRIGRDNIAMNLRINTAEANLRASASITQAPLARLPAGHLVVTTAAVQGNFQPCQTQIGGHTLSGCVHNSLLRQEINPEVDRLAEIAGAEYREFLFGTRHETHPDSKVQIKGYWLSFQATANPVSVPWSAAFISFIVERANLTKSFKFAGAHTTYFSDSKTARLAGDTSRAYWAFPLDERILEVGDLIGYFRIGGICGSASHGYDDLPGSFCSHSDIVVAIRDRAITIGGNVSNTVKVTEVPLTATGSVAPGNKRILIMKRNF